MSHHPMHDEFACEFESLTEEELDAASGGRRCGTVNIIQTPGFGGGYAGGYPGYAGAPMPAGMPYSPYAPMPYSPYGGAGMPAMPYSPYGGGAGYGFPGYGMRLGTAI
jgi:hypothetical protein